MYKSVLFLLDGPVMLYCPIGGRVSIVYFMLESVKHIARFPAHVQLLKYGMLWEKGVEHALP